MNAIRAALGALVLAAVTACGGGGSGGGGGGGGDGGPGDGGGAGVPPPLQGVYLPPSEGADGQGFGYTTAVSQDGSTMVVSASALHVFVRSNDTWVLQAKFRASNPELADHAYASVALSADGNTLAVGQYEESGGGSEAGAVYVFTRTDGEWTQLSYVKASNAGAEDHFGWSVALSGDGRYLAVGATGEDSASNIVNGDQGNSALHEDSGAAYVFLRNGASWIQQAYIKGSGNFRFNYFGSDVALSSDGRTLAVGAVQDFHPQNPNDSGATYIFIRTGTGGDWVEQARLFPNPLPADARFGESVALSSDGNTLAVGAPWESGSPALSESGAAYVFVRSGTNWSQQANLKARHPDEGDRFGSSVSLSSDGNTLALGAIWEDSAATGLNGDETDDTGDDVGATHVFRRSDTTWAQSTYVKPLSDPLADNFFGWSVSLSGDGQHLLIGTASSQPSGRRAHVYRIPGT